MKLDSVGSKYVFYIRCIAIFYFTFRMLVY